MIVDVSDADENSGCGALCHLGHHFRRRDGAVGPRQRLVVERQVILDSNDEHRLVYNQVRADVEQVVDALDGQMESTILSLMNEGSEEQWNKT